MKEHFLPCPIVRDLLPSYIEGLTEDETTQLVSEHLQACSDCASRYTSMKGPELLNTEEQKEQKQVDYLKTVRRRNRKHIVLSVVLVLVLVLAGTAAKLFLIGSPLQLQQVAYQVTSPSGAEHLTLHCTLMDSASDFVHWDTEIEDGTLALTARKVLAIDGSDDTVIDVPLDGIHTVTLMGEPIWQDGLVIDQKTAIVYSKRTPYMGSISNLHALAGTMTLPNVSFTNELQTTSEPYGWTLLFEAPLSPGQQDQMQRAAPLLLALVDNLGAISWTYPDAENGTPVEHTVTVEDVNAQLEGLVSQYNQHHDTNWVALDSVKDYAENIYTCQQLVLLVGA